MTEKEPLIPKHGGYRNLKSFQVSQLVYDLTVRFCNRYIDRFSRTRDQMVQAARSGVQNIAEGSQAAGTSKKTELKLTNVARASLEELRLDYEDFLRQRGLPVWDRQDPRRQALIDKRCQSADEVAAWVKTTHDCGEGGKGEIFGGRSGHCGQSGPSGQKPGIGPSTQSTQSTSSTSSTSSTQSTKKPTPTYPEIAANAALSLLAVATTLLDRQIKALAKSFETQGGFTERLYRVRTANRNPKNRS
ncbi:MAG: four helix bundle suffix domain-containing protein [Desulfobacterales bacterium]|jgi:four helix bundle suffix protein|nr:four helix bundle suffix domain-containing protein [Desulfobacterales bacterium]